MLDFFRHHVTSCPLTFEMQCFFSLEFQNSTTQKIWDDLSRFLKLHSCAFSWNFKCSVKKTDLIFYQRRHLFENLKFSRTKILEILVFLLFRLALNIWKGIAEKDRIGFGRVAWFGPHPSIFLNCSSSASQLPGM